VRSSGLRASSSREKPIAAVTVSSPREDQQVAHAQQLEIREIAVTGHHPRQHVRARVLPPLLDRFREVFVQGARRGGELGLGDIGFVGDDGVFPRRSGGPGPPKADRRGQGTPGRGRCSRDLFITSHSPRLAMASIMSAGVALQHRSRLTQSVRAENGCRILRYRVCSGGSNPSGITGIGLPGG